MTSSKENDLALKENLDGELAKQLRDLGLGALVERAVGSGAGVIMFLWSLVRSHIDKMRELARESIRKKYCDNRIQLLGQKVVGNFSGKDCWAFVHQAGGTVWIQNVYVTATEGLALVVFWHPDHSFKLDKDIIRVYRGVIQCTIENSWPSIRTAD